MGDEAEIAWADRPLHERLRYEAEGWAAAEPAVCRRLLRLAAEVEALEAALADLGRWRDAVWEHYTAKSANVRVMAEARMDALVEERMKATGWRSGLDDD